MPNESHWFKAPNPLIDNLPSYGSLDEVVRVMTNHPLDGLDVAMLSFLEQDQLLVMEKMPLKPTEQSLRTALTIHGMALGSLKLRNPVLASSRALVDRIVDAGQSIGIAYFQEPQQGSSTLLVMGSTGTSKTVTVRQACKLLGTQVIQHQANDAALWLASKQLVFLYVGMSHDGSRGGLLVAILLSLDKALGTKYAVDMPKKFKTIERLSGAIISLLHSLYLGVLIIDEGQLRNMVISDQAELMHLFLLSLMNSGIPLVLVGNPFAFSWMANFSQDGRRLTERSPEFFHPCGAIGDAKNDEWDTVFDGISDYYVLHQPFQNREECSSILKRCSGGIPGLALSLWCNAQRQVLHVQDRNYLEPSDIVHAYQDKGFDAMRDLADGFANKQPMQLLRWRDEDVPVDFYADAWGSPLGDVNVGAGQSTNSVQLLVEPRASKSKRAPNPKAKLKAQESRKANRNLARAFLHNTLTEEDMRKNGLKQHTLQGLELMLAQVKKKNMKQQDSDA